MNSSSEVAESETGEFGDLSTLQVDVRERRPTCVRCQRPLKACLCRSLPARPLDISTCLYIVQHPAEGSRALRTVPLLAACLPAEKCHVLVGRRFSEKSHPDLASVCRDSRTLILYPGPGAQDLEELVHDHGGPEDTAYRNVVIIDGTWTQAKGMFLGNPLLHLYPKRVQLSQAARSQYVIRTQPADTCLSTLECAAVCLSVLERNPRIREILLRPLQDLCSFQLRQGARVHHSKEHLLRNGLYDKRLPKNKRKIKRIEKLVARKMSPDNMSGQPLPEESACVK